MPEHEVKSTSYPLVTFKETSEQSIEYLTPPSLFNAPQKEPKPQYNISIQTDSFLTKCRIYWETQDEYETARIELSSVDELLEKLNKITRELSKLPDLIQFEEFDHPAEEFKHYLLSCLFYQNSQLFIHPDTVVGEGVCFPKNTKFRQFIEEYLEEYRNDIAEYDDTVYHAELNAFAGPSSKRVDIPRLVFPLSEQGTMEKLFPERGSPQALFICPQRKLNICGVANSNTSLIVTSEGLTITEGTFFIRDIPKYFSIEPINYLSPYPKTLDRAFDIIPSNKLMNAYLLEYYFKKNEGHPISDSDREILRNSMYYITMQPNARLLFTEAELTSLEKINDSPVWGYAFTSAGEIAFVKMTEKFDHLDAVKRKHMYAARRRQAEKGSLYDSLTGYTGGIHDSFLGILDQEYLTSMGKYYAEKVGIGNTIFRMNILQSIFSFSLDGSILHAKTILNSPFPTHIAHSNGKLFTATHALADGTTFQNFKKIIPNFSNPRKSRKALLASAAIILASASAILFVEKAIIAGIICTSIALALIILYQSNWLNYALQSTQPKPAPVEATAAPLAEGRLDPLLRPDPPDTSSRLNIK